MPVDNQWLKNISHIIWDLDGTLYPATKALKQKITHNIYRLIADTQNIDLKQAKNVHQELYSQLHSNTQTLIAAGVDRNLVLKGEWFSKSQLEAISLDQEIVEKFHQLKSAKGNSIKHLVNTNSSQKSAKEKLLKLGFDLSDFTAVIGNPDVVGKLKPDPAPYRYILNLTRTSANTHLFVGDRYETDLATAKKVGMHTALVYDHDDRADLNFKNLSSLLDFLIDFFN